jgi:hypothetical protein
VRILVLRTHSGSPHADFTGLGAAHARDHTFHARMRLGKFEKPVSQAMPTPAVRRDRIGPRRFPCSSPTKRYYDAPGSRTCALLSCTGTGLAISSAGGIGRPDRRLHWRSELALDDRVVLVTASSSLLGSRATSLRSAPGKRQQRTTWLGQTR